MKMQTQWGYNELARKSVECAKGNAGNASKVGGVIRVIRDAEHGRRRFSVVKTVDGQWLSRDDMDTPSSHAQVRYKDTVNVNLSQVSAPLTKSEPQ